MKKKINQRLVMGIWTWIGCALLISTFSIPAFSAPKRASTSTNFLPLPPGPTFSLRQGGDTIESAVDITLPFFGTGTTVGHSDNYDAGCYYGAPGPDVWYRLIPETDVVIEVDLWGSQYDTRLFVIDEELNSLGCSDDYYPHNDSSYLGELSLVTGRTYFIGVSGTYDEGEYVIRVEEYEQCQVSCIGEPEGEPPLEGNYIDQFNGGCLSPEFDYPEQELIGDENGELVFCGSSGWYMLGSSYQRDLDYFAITFGLSGTVEVTSTQQELGMLYHSHLRNCESSGLIEFWSLPPCHPWTVTLTGDPGSQTWLIFAPYQLNPPNDENVYEFDYELSIQGLQHGPVATEKMSWGGVKAFYK